MTAAGWRAWVLLCGVLLALAAPPLVAGQAAVTIEFRGEVHAKWEAIPQRRSVTVPRGEIFEAVVRVRNKSDHEAVVMVLTEVRPQATAGSLVHLGCGPTFTLILKPGEAVAVPASYFVAEGAPEEVGTFDMTYAVYSFEALSPDPLQVGRRIYAARCVSCHGALGRGDGPIARFLQGGVQDLVPALREKGDAALLDAVSGGMGPMPAFAPALAASERRAVLLHLRSLDGGRR